MKKERMTIVQHSEIARNIYELKVTGSITSEIQEPGQFVHLRVTDGTDPLLRRPISICNVDVDTQMLTMIYRAEGKGTTLLAQKDAGQKIDVLGPLGHGFPINHIQEGQEVLLVGGGIGVPPLYYLSKQLKSRGARVTHVFGFQTKDVVFYEEAFQKLGPTYIATVDGTHGHQGFVTDVIKAEQLETFDTLYSCGPLPMLKALQTAYRDRDVYISLEERMGCGIGACFACVCHTPEGETSYKKVCSDGPVFKAGEVIL